MFEAALEYFEIEDEIDLQLCLPFDSMEGHFPRIGCIEQVAVDVACSQLFDLRELELQGGVDPVEQFSAGCEIAALQHSRYHQNCL